MGQRLRLGIDTRDLQTAVSGQKTYLEELLQALKVFDGKELELILFKPLLPVYRGKGKWARLLEHGRLHTWKQVILPLKAGWRGCDVLFTTDYFVPYFRFGFKTVTVFHDAFFFQNPEHYSPLFLKFFHGLAVPAALRCSRIVVPSVHVQQKLAHFLKLPLQQLTCIYEAPKSFSKNQDTLSSSGQQPRELSGQPYLLHVGMLNKRKNIPFLIHAFKEARKTIPSLKLVLAGSMEATLHINDKTNILQAIAETGLSNEVILMGYLRDDELKALYQHASLYVFPSLNEGFGLPVLEAFMHGIPVLVANNSCLPEIGGAAVVSFDPYDTKDLAGKIVGVLSDPKEQERMKVAGYKRLAQFSWQKAASELVAVCRSVV